MPEFVSFSSGEDVKDRNVNSDIQQILIKRRGLTEQTDQVGIAREKLASFTCQVAASLGLIVILNMLVETGGGRDQEVGRGKEDTGMTVMMIEELTARTMNRREGRGTGEERKKRKRNISEGS